LSDVLVKVEVDVDVNGLGHSFEMMIMVIFITMIQLSAPGFIHSQSCESSQSGKGI